MFVLFLSSDGLGGEALLSFQNVDSTGQFKKVVLSRGENAPIDKASLKNLVLPAESHFKVDPAYVSRHDVVYLTPNFGPYEGFPMGNGDLGGMIWTKNEGIEIQVNKSNAYDRRADGHATLKSLGRLNIRLGVPCFEWLDLDDFEGRLSLHDATVRYKSETKYIKTKIEAMTCANQNIWMITCEAEMLNSLLDTPTVSVDFERYGSRTLGSFKGGWGPAKVEDFGNPKTTIMDKDIVLTESFKDIGFAVAVRVLGADTKARLLNKRRGSIDFKLSSKQKITVLLSAITSEESSKPLEASRKMLDGITLKNLDAVKQTHNQWWNDFWNRSFVHIGDDYLENLYHIRRYLMAAGSRAEYPIIYHAGLWQWNRDVRNWGALMGWNQLNTYVGLHAQNDCDLMLPHIGLYWRLFPKAKAFANKIFGVKDALYMGEPHSVRGWSAYTQSEDNRGHRNNFTVIPHITRFFMMQYEFTQDTDFLKIYTYPYAKAAGEMYVQYLKWDDKAGRYTIFPAKPYECGYGVLLKDTITDLSMIRYLFPRLIKYSEVLGVDADKREKWQHILDNLWEPPTIVFEGVGTIYAEAYDENGNGWPGTDNKYDRRYHFSAGSALAFPGDLIDLDDKGTEPFNILNRFLDLHPDYKTAISMDPIVAARLGNTERMLWLIDNAVKYSQPYPQGLMYNMNWSSVGSDRMKKDRELTEDKDDAWLAADYLYDLRTLNNAGNRRQPGCQMGMEPLCIQAAAVNEMLLHSHDGKVRVFPAVPNEWEAAFILRASGGFMVSSSKEKNKEPDHVFVTSTVGNDFKMVNPWKTDKLKVKTKDGKPVDFDLKNDIIAFETKADTAYRITPQGTELKQKTFESKPNKAAKHRGYTVIGKDRDFNLTAKIKR